VQVVAIDLGSNSLQVVKYDCQNKSIVANYTKTVRTAEGLVDSGKVSKSAIRRIVLALKEASNIVGFKDCKIKAVTTQALRVATNAKEVINNIKKQSGIEFDIISPQTEAELTLLAVKARLNMLGIKQNFVLCDIGGGSTELSYYIDGKIYSKSFELGIVTASNSTKSLDELKEFIKKRAKEIANFASTFDNSKLIFTATAGTPTTIAAMKHNLVYDTYDANIVTGTKLSLDELNYYLNKLLQMSTKERQIAVGVGRDDLIVAGVVIFQEIYKILNKDSSIVIDDGLSMGVAISSCLS
jgi:exopolyphosphatase/guanosine-5'-triphosphate,3'-diphosphate pyrophosphatase